MALFMFTKAILDNRPIDIYNHGEMKRDFTYIDDAVEGVFRIINKSPTHMENSVSSGAPYRVYNIGNGSAIELMEFIESIERSLGKKALKNMLPMQPGDVPSTWADTTNLKCDFGFQPTTPVKKGIEFFVDWYLKYYKT